MESIVVKLQEWLAFYGLKVVAALAILVLGRIAAGIVRRLLRKVMTKGKVEPTLISFVCSVVYVGVLAFVVIAALGQLGVQTASFIAVLGAAGLAIGLALQGSLANFASGVLMVIFTPFKVGDFVEAGGGVGTVEEIGIFSTMIKSVDNKKIIIPNAQVTGGVIINHTAEKIRRVDLVAGVSYGDNLDLVKKTLEEVMAAEPRVLQTPAPKIAVSELGDSSVNFVVRPWVNTHEYWDVRFALQEAIKKAFDAKGISIPFPQRDLHLDMPKEVLRVIAEEAAGT
ncbi:mechanosensitive ion channel protein [Desulfoluna limicola]|uniref:Mechanosensitive ion channel protein n=1 Tax=Desulfoluna limicola TaxID=2810562 RepID=A0ABN6FCJ3_9BACT|nr:mechanosensitive ion channel domain-containing protein [Desulfoluna limicola]BCS98709.1 mechanosensitive ion channel protein [Desulfoluna limicola]